jgi:hypothetical protein
LIEKMSLFPGQSLREVEAGIELPLARLQCRARSGELGLAEIGWCSGVAVFFAQKSHARKATWVVRLQLKLCDETFAA